MRVSGKTTSVCERCGVPIDGTPCNAVQAQECPNNQPRVAYVGEVPDTDAYYADDSQYQ